MPWLVWCQQKVTFEIPYQFWDTSLCFVNSHLAAHVGQTKARNGHYRGMSSHVIALVCKQFSKCQGQLDYTHHIVSSNDCSHLRIS